MSDNSNELEEVKKLAEFHAYSVRQLIAQRTRILQVTQTAGSVAKFDNGTDILAVLKQIETSPSQYFQDIYCLLLNRGKREGFFVEFGACDGMLLSNTWALESEFGWRGILSEPMPSWHQALKKNRNCIIDKHCIWVESAKHIEFAEYEGDEYKTESSAVIAGRPTTKAVSKLHIVETITLADLLRYHSAPREIDFLSIDVEGAEYDILSGFPFEEYKFNFIVVEQKGDMAFRMSDLLRKFGYKQVFQDASGHDGFYVPEECVAP